MASRSVNKVILLGNLGKDAETRYTPSGTAVSNFTVATNRRWKDQQTGEWKDETEWHRCVLWKSENRANYLTKGTNVFIEGRLQTRSWDDKDGQKRYSTEIVVEDLILLSSRGAGGAGGDQGLPAGAAEFDRPSGPVSVPRSAPRSQAPPAAPPEDFQQGVTDDDVPF
ncbi:MAG TPA: single-stranded DNA-binding protein [Bryobacteraceae bacterium]|nr:single-stranded DNA-binding protein [Bryobacteraceae bacterium]